MISADHINIDTGWLILQRLAGHDTHYTFDIEVKQDVAAWVCPQCETAGQHRCEFNGWRWVIPMPTRTLRVHVVEVLPIRSLMDDPVYPSITKRPRTHDGDTGFTLHDANRRQTHGIELPAAAECGMWAVRLEVHS